jgi:hypothetical protein
MVDQTTLDLGGAVSATQSVTQMVVNSLTADRSVVVEIDNNTDLTLKFHSAHHMHGGFAKTPLYIIPPKTAPNPFVVFGSQKKGMSVATGTEGYVRYICENPQLCLTVWWDNPYIGDNKGNARLDWAANRAYKVFYIVGVGNTAAEFRFQLFPADIWPTGPQIQNITDSG